MNMIFKAILCFNFEMGNDLAVSSLALKKKQKKKITDKIVDQDCS